MFFFISLVIFLLGLVPLITTGARAQQYETGERRRKLRPALMVFLFVTLFLIGYNLLFIIYSELLWFENLGFEKRFWTMWWAKTLLYFAGVIVAFIFLFVNTRIAFDIKGIKKYGLAAFVTSIVPSLILGIWTLNLWEKMLLFINRPQTELADPVFGRPIGFYLFSLPLYSSLIGWFIFLFIFGLIVIIGSYLSKTNRTAGESREEEKRHRSMAKQILVLASITLLALGWNSYLAIFRLMYS